MPRVPGKDSINREEEEEEEVKEEKESLGKFMIVYSSLEGTKSQRV